MSDYSDAERLKLIRRAFADCGQEATQEAVERQFRYETGRDLTPRPSICDKKGDADVEALP